MGIMNKSDLLPAKPELKCWQCEDIFNDWYDSVFADAVEVTAYIGEYTSTWGPDREKKDTHRALMLKPVPIKRGVSKQEILQSLQWAIEETTKYSLPGTSENLDSVRKRIEQEGILNE